MAFIRVKKSKGNEYASLVESTYNKTTQEKEERVIKNCGRLFTCEKKHTLSFSEYITQRDGEGIGSYLATHHYEQVIKDLLGYVLYQHSFAPLSEMVLPSNKKQRKLLASLSSSVALHPYGNPLSFYLAVDLNTFNVFETRFNRPCTLKIHPGFLNDYTLHQLLESRLTINPTYDAESQIKRLFIQKMLRSGLLMEQNVLILVYQKFLDYIRRTQKVVSYEMPSLSERSDETDTETYHSKKDFMDDFL